MAAGGAAIGVARPAANHQRQHPGPDQPSDGDAGAVEETTGGGRAGGGGRMFTFAKIAGGAPSTAAGMTNHLLAKTLSVDDQRLALYYSRGMVAPGIDRLISGVVQAVADG